MIPYRGNSCKKIILLAPEELTILRLCVCAGGVYPPPKPFFVYITQYTQMNVRKDKGVFLRCFGNGRA